MSELKSELNKVLQFDFDRYISENEVFLLRRAILGLYNSWSFIKNSESDVPFSDDLTIKIRNENDTLEVHVHSKVFNRSKRILGSITDLVK